MTWTDRVEKDLEDARAAVRESDQLSAIPESQNDQLRRLRDAIRTLISAVEDLSSQVEKAISDRR